MTDKMNDFVESKSRKINSTSVEINAGEGDSEDEIQVSLAPYIQTYLAQHNSSHSCGCLPVPFERAAPHSWMLPCFDSDILEKQFKISSLKQYTKRFRFALIYVMIVSAAWLIFLLSQPFPETIRFEYIIFAQLFLFSIWILFLSFKDIYRSHDSIFGIATALHLVFTSLVFTLASGSAMVSHFTLACCIILAIYTVFPLQPYISLIICLSFSVAFETILLTTQKHLVLFYYGFVVRVLCQICVHIIGFHILVMTHVRVRGTFMKVGQRLLVQKQLEMEKRLKENIIHSVMPPKVASWLLGGECGENPRPSNHEDFGSLFRPFNMNRMDNVSILFADIVGFTRMSSNKTAEEIVDILNDLFERFDDLCLANGCEKISTLGDCYYCVSGCPEPRPDHANCCVEMGLDMIDAIQEFDVDRGEDVNMRVGVHTGTVLCGIVGTRRFKFDVWSNDVTFANKLESTGLPGRVHISEKTAQFLRDAYVLENYEDLQGTKTYLIKTRAPFATTQETKATEPHTPNNFNGNRKSINFSNSPSKRSHYLSLITDARSKFVSLPNVLGSNRTLTGSFEKLNYSQWFSFSKLKNNSSSEMSSSLKHSSQRNSVLRQDDATNKSIVSKGEVSLRRDLKNEEEISLCPSVNNRSSVRNSNRRSSIQQQIYLLNNLNSDDEVAKKMGSYYSMSQSTLAPLDSESDNEGAKKPVSDGLNLGYYSLKKQSDMQLIKCINDISQNSYIVKIPLRRFTLFFKDKKTEKEYRANAHDIHEKRGDNLTTLSTTRFNTYFDIFVSGLILICTTISLYVLHEAAPYTFIGVSTVALLLESGALILCLVHLAKTAGNKIREKSKFIGSKIFDLFSKWYPWHMFGGMLVTLPTLVIITNLACHYFTEEEQDDYSTGKTFPFDFLSSGENKKLILSVELRDHYYTLLILIGLLHFCNFAQLNFFMKSFLALITGTTYLLLFGRANCQYRSKSNKSVIFISQFLQRNVFVNQTQGDRKVFFSPGKLKQILSELSDDAFDPTNYYNLGIQFLDMYYYYCYYYYANGTESDEVFYATADGVQFLGNLNETVSGMTKEAWLNNIFRNINHQVLSSYFSETVLDVCVVIFLVILLNRQFEISYRLSYYCNTESSRDKMRVQNMKNQADWLLENIIPKHVSIELKNRAKYCKTHSNVGIMFASIVNFNKLYDESYSGGKEYLRVLNELISDFDELLNVDKFKNVDKIKTIGSTFMGASGLNPALRKGNQLEWDHVYELVNFALEMYKVVDVFNRDLLGFNLVLRVGLNIGEVTAGVIGSSKLFYDIWGDAVNVASRMDSCGVDGRIQVPHSCIDILSGKYDLEQRGQVYIKGKGDILVYLVK